MEENAVAVDDPLDADDAKDNVGRLVTATDPDPNEDALTYTLGGTDKDSFTVKNNGQIEVGAGTKLDYETKDTYMVTVMAEDSFGASASIALTIKVTDLDEEPEIMRVPDANVAPEFASATTSRTVAENTAAGEAIGNPVAANDANGGHSLLHLGRSRCRVLRHRLGHGSADAPRPPWTTRPRAHLHRHGDCQRLRRSH